MKRAKNEKTLVGVRLDNALVDEIDETAEQLGINRSGVITLLLKRYYYARLSKKDDILMADALLKGFFEDGTR